MVQSELFMVNKNIHKSLASRTFLAGHKTAKLYAKWKAAKTPSKLVPSPSGLCDLPCLSGLRETYYYIYHPRKIREDTPAKSEKASKNNKFTQQIVLPFKPLEFVLFGIV